MLTDTHSLIMFISSSYVKVGSLVDWCWCMICTLPAGKAMLKAPSDLNTGPH